MLKLVVFVVIATLSCHAFPRYHRLRREADSADSEPCKNTYDQCPDWKGQGMCVSDQYKDYMMTVCPVTCEFCKENHARDEIAEPENFYEMNEEQSREEEAGDEQAEEEDASDSNESESGDSEDSEESGSGETEAEEAVAPVVAAVSAPTPAPAVAPAAAAPQVVAGVTGDAKATVADGSGASEEEESGENEDAEEEDDDDDDDAAPVQPVKQQNTNSKKAAKGSISLLLKQNFRSSFKNQEDASFQMLEGNVKRDFEKALKGAKVKDISFSEGNVEGNPRQNGKTKVSLTISSDNNQKMMKTLLKMVDTDQSVNGLSVVAGSLEFDE